MARRTTQNGHELDDLVVEAVRGRKEPISFPTLLEEVRTHHRPDVDDMELRHVLWRLIDEHRLDLNRDRLIEVSS